MVVDVKWIFKVVFLCDLYGRVFGLLVIIVFFFCVGYMEVVFFSCCDSRVWVIYDDLFGEFWIVCFICDL